MLKLFVNLFLGRNKFEKKQRCINNGILKVYALVKMYYAQIVLCPNRTMQKFYYAKIVLCKIVLCTNCTMHKLYYGQNVIRTNCTMHIL